MEQAIAIETIQAKLKESPCHKVTLVFDQPIESDISRYKSKVSFHLNIAGIFNKDNSWWYCTRRNARKGYYFSQIMSEHLVSVQPNTKSDEFASYEEFKSMFDLSYIREAEIQHLWNSTSAQHGGKYRRSDFKSVSKRNRQMIIEFMASLGSINNENAVRLSWGSRGPSGRDITIRHQANSPYITFSSEFYNCGNGSYYLLVGANRILHLEND